MIDLCRTHALTIKRIDRQGIWLEADDELVHLPLREAPDAAVDDVVEAFVYRDRTGHLQATLREPIAEAGEFACLTVRSVGPHGAFLDWGLAKDLLVPHALQPERMQTGHSYLVKVDVDEQGRAYANARLDDLLDREPADVLEGERVDLIVRQFTNLGAKVIINGRFSGLLYRDDLPEGVPVGARLEGYVRRVRPDGKLDITLHKIGAEGVIDAKQVIVAALEKAGGALPLSDASSPDAIKAALGMSKKTFKKAVGGLYREGKVILGDGEVRLTGQEEPRRKK